jgi:hypothetical protein
MRDPDRIRRLLNKIRDKWVTQPDTRLLQLIINQVPNLDPEHLYYLEDDTLERFLDETNTSSIDDGRTYS